jgi:uncharacterized protein
MADMGALDDAAVWVERLHAIVDELAAPLAEAHGARLHCQKGCTGCCVDSLSVFDIEAAVVRRHYTELLANGTPHAGGACAFLDEKGACRIYEHRPYVCRTQGMPLRWLDTDEDGAPIEARDICPLNVAGVPLEELPADVCWTLGPFEQRLRDRQGALDGGRGDRVELRSLFARAAEADPPSDPTARRRLPVLRSK